MTREPMVAVGLIGFPLATVLVLAGVFGQVPDPEFGGVAPDDHYLAGYIGVVLAALGLITLPVHIATARELGVTAPVPGVGRERRSDGRQRHPARHRARHGVGGRGAGGRRPPCTACAHRSIPSAWPGGTSRG